MIQLATNILYCPSPFLFFFINEIYYCGFSALIPLLYFSHVNRGYIYYLFHMIHKIRNDVSMGLYLN